MIEFTRADITDANELMQIVVRAFNDETRRFGPGRDGGPPGYDSIDWTSAIIKKGLFYHKILYNGIIVGGFNVEKVEASHYMIDLIFVDPQYQNKGIGLLALKYIHQSFTDAKKWSLETPFYSVRNQHLYEKEGYIKVGETDSEEDGFYLFKYEKQVV